MRALIPAKCPEQCYVLGAVLPFMPYINTKEFFKFRNPDQVEVLIIVPASWMHSTRQIFRPNCNFCIPNFCLFSLRRCQYYFE